MKGGERKTMINMRIMTKRVVGSYKHKKCKMRTTKIEVKITRKIAKNCSEEGGSLKCLSFK
jgi:hypothetical protein